ncbi:hypothetical protein [Kitasatospora paranensis]|uniref:Uncharacterized protein n=1 Tax=Kitasatospora paranensis TaxID=258053 RepID=A0ABW2G646_9ACTN
MSAQPARAVGVLGPVARPERLLVAWNGSRAVTALLDEAQSRTVGTALRLHSEQHPRPSESRRLIRWLHPPMDVLVDLDDVPPRLCHPDRG